MLDGSLAEVPDHLRQASVFGAEEHASHLPDGQEPGAPPGAQGGGRESESIAVRTDLWTGWSLPMALYCPHLTVEII